MRMTYWLNEGTVHTLSTDKLTPSTVYTAKHWKKSITLKVKEAPTAFFLMNIYVCI